MCVPVAETSARGARLGEAKPAKSEAEVLVTRLPRKRLWWKKTPTSGMG